MNWHASSQQVHNAVIIDLSDAGQIWDPVLSAYFYRFEPDSFTITPLVPPKESSPQSSPANFTSFFYFKGIWGDTQYADSDPRQETIPNFGVKRFLDGPTGPRDKHLVRKGLRPDEKRYMSWTEWAVTLFMAWYPCCIRGWRKWISLGVIIASIAGIVVGIILGIRTYRVRRTYRKVQVEDIPLVDRRREEEGLLSSSDDDKDDWSALGYPLCLKSTRLQARQSRILLHRTLLETSFNLFELKSHGTLPFQRDATMRGVEILMAS